MFRFCPCPSEFSMHWQGRSAFRCHHIVTYNDFITPQETACVHTMTSTPPNPCAPRCPWCPYSWSLPTWDIMSISLWIPSPSEISHFVGTSLLPPACAESVANLLYIHAQMFGCFQIGETINKDTIHLPMMILVILGTKIRIYFTLTFSYCVSVIAI